MFTIEKQPPRTWNITEIKVLKTLFHHFGKDYKVLAQEMSNTFVPKQYLPMGCRGVLLRNGPKNLYDRSPLKHQEISFIHKQFLKLIKSGNKQIWQEIALSFPKRDIVFLREQYYFLLKMLVKTMCYHYITNLKFRRFYFSRLKRMLYKSWFIIIHVSQLVVPNLYAHDSTVIKIVESCAILERYISIFINLQQYVVSDYTNYPKLQGIEQLPFYESEELMQILEPLLVIDTLCRMFQCLAPYDFELYDVSKRFKKKQDYSNTTIDDLTLIPERQMDIVYENYSDLAKRDSYAYLYLQISPKQIELLINSDVMRFLLPICFTVDQRYGKEPKHVFIY